MWAVRGSWASREGGADGKKGLGCWALLGEERLGQNRKATQALSRVDLGSPPQALSVPPTLQALGFQLVLGYCHHRPSPSGSSSLGWWQNRMQVSFPLFLGTLKQVLCGFPCREEAQKPPLPRREIPWQFHS